VALLGAESCKIEGKKATAHNGSLQSWLVKARHGLALSCVYELVCIALYEELMVTYSKGYI